MNGIQKERTKKEERREKLGVLSLSIFLSL
jgi:hypothetical protein